MNLASRCSRRATSVRRTVVPTIQSNDNDSDTTPWSTSRRTGPAGHPPECMRSAPAGTAQSSGSVEPAFGQRDLPRRALPSSRSFRVRRERDVRVELREQSGEFVEGLNQRHRRAACRSRPGSRAGTTRRACGSPAALVLAEVGGEQLGVPVDDARDLAERRRRRRRAPANRRRQFGEQPRPPEAAAADHDPVAAGLAPSSRSASAASKMSPLPSTGMLVTCCLSAAI